VTSDLTDKQTVLIVIEIAGNEDVSIGMECLKGINSLAETVSNSLTEGTAVTLATITAGGVDNEHMQGVARHYPTCCVENIAGRPHILDR
jgi:hypothetical protein